MSATATASTLRFSSSKCHSTPFTVSLPSPRAWLSSFGASSFARQSVLSVLQNGISNGHLTITDSDQTFYFGRRTKGCTDVSLNVVNKTFWTRVLMSGDLGFSEAFIIGDVEADDLQAVIELWLDNENQMSGLSSTLFRLSSAISGVVNAWLGQTRSQARLNAIAGYDQSNELFKAFLSMEMMYSCALWGPEEGGPQGDLERPPSPTMLEAAQHRKIRHVLGKARVKRGDRILEFGSGWGGLAIEAVLTYGCEVDTLTLSIEQKTLAEERIAKLGLQDKIRVHLMDYRELPPEWEKAFDAFISIEMLEHVGSQYYYTYFKLVDWALKSENAMAVVTTTTFPESRYSAYQSEDFMRRYMWPNSVIPSAVTLINAANSASQGRFLVESVENHAAHYPRTLREWGRRLERNLTQSVMAKDFPTLRDRAEFDALKRKWQYLFAYAGAGFCKGYIALHMLTFSRGNDPPNFSA